MKVLITGCNGQLGNALIELLKNKRNSLGAIPENFNDCEIIAIDIDDLDISDREATINFINTNKPDVIINCAAMTNVDGCESNKDVAFSANADGPENLAIAAEQIGAKLIHVSTDYVFDGTANTPYIESDHCSPNGVYGASKLQGEINVKNNCSKYFIVRTSWLYGYIGKNFVKTMRWLGKTKGAIKVVNDQRGNPTNADDLAYHLILLADTEYYGIYHCTGNGECTWYDFACKIIEYSKINCTVSPCTSDEFPSPTKRPSFSSLRNLGLENTVGDNMRQWEVALKEYIINLDKMEE